MPSTNATFPLRARSMMSPPARGQSRTRLPFASSTPRTTTLWSAGLSSYSRKKSSILRLQHPDITESAVQSHKFLRRERLAPLQYLPPPRVGGAHLFFLLVREVEDVQDEHLVDLGPVEQVAGALGGDLRVVVEDDRGREQRAPVPLFPDEHRPRLQVLASLRSLPQPLRRVNERDELPSSYFQGGVGRDEGLPERALPVLATPRGGIGDPDRDPEDPFLQELGPHLYRSAQRTPAAHQGTDDLSGRLCQRFLPAPPANIYLCLPGRPQ